MRKRELKILLFALTLCGVGAIATSCDDENKGNPPTVTTADVTGIIDISAVGGGEVTSSGGSNIVALGVCYSTTNTTPTIEDNYVSTGTYTTKGIVEDEWIFSTNFKNLTPVTKYYVRAYAANEGGVAYGPVKEFTTKAGKTFHTLTANMIETFTQEYWEGPKESLVDGDLTTYWHSAYSDEEGYPNAPLPHHIQINFPTDKKIGGFIYWFRNPSGTTDRPTQFDFQVSSNNTDWTTVWTSAQNLPYTWASPAEYEAGRTMEFGANYTSKYFRIRILHTVGNRDWTHLAEIKVFEDGTV